MANNNGVNCLPYKYSFCYQLTTDELNVTGDGTAYTIPYSTKIYDTGNCIASGIFTAPSSGTWFIGASVQTSGKDTSISSLFSTVSVLAGWVSQLQFFQSPPGGAGGGLDLNDSFYKNTGVVALQVNDTISIIVQYGGGTKTVDVLGATGALKTLFYGGLLNEISF